MQRLRRNRVLLIVGLLALVLGIFVFYILSDSRDSNPNAGGTGGDYTPSGWVVMSGVPEVAGVTNEQYSDITTKLSTELQKEHTEPEYSATYVEASLKTTGERYVFINTSFSVLIAQTNETYRVVIHSDLVEGIIETTVTKL